MTKFLVCGLNDENYTQANYKFCNTFDEAKQECVNLIMGEYNFKTQKEAIKNMNLEKLEGKVYKYNYSDGDNFCVNFIIGVEVNEGDYLLVWHHAYNGVDFHVEKIGTEMECINSKAISSNAVYNKNGVDIDIYNLQTVVDTGEEWEIWDIIKYNGGE